ncbi:CASC3/Barentsz eIF4AIII binding domain containing protein [Elaphomyces granulatus]
MAPYRRPKIGASRRRREDEGEDEGSVGGELDDDSMSDGSVVSQQEEDDADGDGRDASEDEASIFPQADGSNGPVNGRVQEAKDGRSPSPGKRLFASTMSDTEAMINGIKLADPTSELKEIRFGDLQEEEEDESGRTPSGPNPPDSKREALAEKRRREHEEYVKNREENPAFVPTRGGFFLHDKRSTEPETNGYHSFNKPKSRPYGLIVDGNVGRRPPKTDASDGPWPHDLYETVAREEAPTSQSPVRAPTSAAPTSSKGVPTAPRSSPPNRSFSSTVLIGNVPVVVFLPGMVNPIPYTSVPKRQYTRLPQHRPPLRRDKPVRISLPGQPPRYIFPATERSFIFIPRALRPNQQSFRGRGRGGFYSSRRPSIYPGGSYPPSVPMSRRSSFGRGPSREGLNSPAGSVLSRQTIGATTENGKPIVRLPPPARPPGAYQLPTNVGLHIPSAASMPPPYPQAPNSAFRESRPAPIPMHQPRPQKAVSVADIESPVSFPFNPPQPQQGQPFHQQVPLPVSAPGYADGPPYPHARHASHPSQASGTPLPHLPERAIHAPPFHPYNYPPPAYYPAPYPAVFVTSAEYPPYGPPVGPGAPPFVSPGQPVPFVIPPPAIPGEQPTQPGTVAHEAGGTIYYNYNDASQYYSNPFPIPAPTAAASGVVGMGGMMTPPASAYLFHPHIVYQVNGDTGWGRP